jgi:hypothetical protein
MLSSLSSLIGSAQMSSEPVQAAVGAPAASSQSAIAAVDRRPDTSSMNASACRAHTSGSTAAMW